MEKSMGIVDDLRLSGNHYRVTDIRDLNAREITNLFRTGTLEESWIHDHTGKATVHIPMESVFNTPAGRSFELSDFGIIKTLFSDNFRPQDHGLQSEKTYTLPEIQNKIPGIEHYNIKFEHGEYGLNDPNFVDFAYVLGTQSVTLDGRTKVHISKNGEVTLTDVYVRLNTQKGASFNGSTTENFDFDGGGLGAKTFNFLNANDIESWNAVPVDLVFEGNGKHIPTYGKNAFKQELSTAKPFQKMGIFELREAYDKIVDDLVKKGIIQHSSAIEYFKGGGLPTIL